MKASISFLVLLLSIEAFVNAAVLPQNQQLIEASTNGNIDKVKNILQTSQMNTVDINNSLIKAVENGHNQIVDVLLQNNANVNYKDDDDGSTALMWAAHNGHKETAEILLQYGAEVNAKNDDGNTALIIAAYKGLI